MTDRHLSLVPPSDTARWNALMAHLDPDDAGAILRRELSDTQKRCQGLEEELLLAQQELADRATAPWWWLVLGLAAGALLGLTVLRRVVYG